MNHDATHCLDYKKSCPKSCYRAKLTEELSRIVYPLPVSWMHLKDTKECPKGKQIPREPVVRGVRPGREVNTVSYTCPSCHKHIGRDNYCKHCGQALDWSE